MYCSVLQFPDENSKLKSLLSESHVFDSVIFIFEGCRRYKFEKSILGITSVSDLLSPLGSGLFRNSPLWSYYLYPCCSNFGKDIDGLCGEVIRLQGGPVLPRSCHMFVHRSKRQVKILYFRDGSPVVEHRRLNGELYSLRKGELKMPFLPIPWGRFNEILTVHKAGKHTRFPVK